MPDRAHRCSNTRRTKKYSIRTSLAAASRLSLTRTFKFSVLTICVQRSKGSAVFDNVPLSRSVVSSFAKTGDLCTLPRGVILGLRRWAAGGPKPPGTRESYSEFVHPQSIRVQLLLYALCLHNCGVWLFSI